MTAIAIWCNFENIHHPGLWVAADSRVSQAAGPVLVEDAAKVFALPIVCRSPGTEGFFSEVSYTNSFGYCFAGSTLMGQNAYLALLPLLGNLSVQDGYVPSLAEVAKYVHRYLSLKFDDYKLRQGEGAMFEVAIFGHCHRTKTLSAFHFSPELKDGVYSMSIAEYSNMQDKEFLYLGDRKRELSEMLKVAFEGKSVPGRPLSRIPRYVIQDCIDNGTFPSIGGDIQIGIADSFGFRQFVLCKPRVHGQSAAFFSYLGRELTDELTWLGEAHVGGNGMA